MRKVLVTIEGGCVQSVHTDDPQIEVCIRDFDVQGGDEDDLREDEDGVNYRDYEPIHYAWADLNTKPFEGRMSHD